MFGYPCAFVQGNLFMGLFEQSMMLRLCETDRATFLALDGAGPFEPMAGRPMKEYALVPVEMLRRPDELTAWVRRSLDYAASLPPKEKKPKKPKKPKKAAAG